MSTKTIKVDQHSLHEMIDYAYYGEMLVIRNRIRMIEDLTRGCEHERRRFSAWKDGLHELDWKGSYLYSLTSVMLGKDVDPWEFIQRKRPDGTYGFHSVMRLLPDEYEFAVVEQDSALEPPAVVRPHLVVRKQQPNAA